MRMKILVASHVSGRRLLEKRLVIDCWRRLVRCSEKWNKTVSKLDKKDLFEKVEALESRVDNFSKVRKEMGIRPCELRTMLMSDAYRMEKFKIEKPTTGKWDSSDETTLLQEIFKILDISNITEYDPQKMEIPWTKLAIELKDELNRSPTMLLSRWSDYIFPR